MPLNAVNLMKDSSFGVKIFSEGIEYTVIFHLGNNLALACRSTDKFPAPVYFVQIDMPEKKETEGDHEKDRAVEKGLAEKTGDMD